MDKFRPVTKSLSVGLGAFRRAAVATPASRCYSTRANDKYAGVIHFSKLSILFGGTAVAAEYFKYLIDYGGYKSEAEKCRVLSEEIDKECKLHEDLWKRMEERREERRKWKY